MAENQLHNFSKKFKKTLESFDEWSSIQSIFQSLDKIGRLCWISGGAVRDIIRDKIPHDFDLTTDATDEEILKLFPNAILVGRQFGVYKIPFLHTIFDLTVFREEDNYTDGRRPKEVRPATPDKDALRRDFTMNALFWDIKNEVLVDYVDGFSDLLHQTIKCVGAPSARFQEDHLRILRMVRFASQFHFSVDADAYQAGLKQAALVQNISGERILAEILKIETTSNRLLLYKDKVFLEIMKHNNFVFCDLDLKLSSLAKAKNIFSNEKHVLAELFYLLNFNAINLKLLVARFKFSAELRKFLEKINEIFVGLSENQDFVFFCLLIDRSADYLNIIKYFLSLNLIKAELAQQIIDTNLEFSKAIIEAHDVISIVPADQISKTLADVRAWQIRHKIHDRKACLEFVKNTRRPVK